MGVTLTFILLGQLTIGQVDNAKVHANGTVGFESMKACEKYRGYMEQAAIQNNLTLKAKCE